MKIHHWLLFLPLLWFAGGCSIIPQPDIPPEEPGVDELKPPEPADIADPSPQPDQSVPTPLAPEPRTITFSTPEGKELTGKYYPGAENPSPLVILMHWYPGDHRDWAVIAPWLQNRGSVESPVDLPWRDAAWFPPLPAARSYAVFTFTFRGCDGGCQETKNEQWLIDASTAAEFAASLPGADPERIAIIGASIGADGAISACEHLLEIEHAACRGAFTLSPGNYLHNDYQASVHALGDAVPPRPVHCLYDVNDHTADLCKDVTGDNFSSTSYSGGYLHGMHLINPDLDPNPLHELLGFLEDVLSPAP